MHYLYTAGMNSIQYTVRNIPPQVDEALRRRAKKAGKSFNQTIVDELSKASGAKTADKLVHHDLDWLLGSGGIGLEERAALEAQHQIDEKLWDA